MATDTSPTAHPGVTCAENIAFLHLLHPVPALPSRNEIGHLARSPNVYTLSFQQERDLTGTLAFLAGLKDGPEHIPAVCIEENEELKCLNVQIAVNKARPGDGDAVLKDIKAGFKKIFALLGRAADERLESTLQHELFSLIVSICSTRILCRLRFTPNSRGVPKQPIKEVLNETIAALQRLKNAKTLPNNLLPVAKVFIDQARQVIKLIDAWTRHQVSARLEELITGMHRLSCLGQLKTLFAAIPKSILDPSITQNLLNTTLKVGRYKDAARLLYRMARKIPIVRNMRVILAEPPLEAFDRFSLNKTSLGLVSKLNWLKTAHKQKWNIDQIYRSLKTTEAAAATQFSQCVQKSLNDGKIHAEVQLISYITLKRSKLIPRVVCSTKDACYLCNLLIKTHGIHTPGSHGKLYTKWRIPQLLQIKELECQFNAVLEMQLVKSITTLLQRQKKTSYPDPCESTLLTLSVSASTIAVSPKLESTTAIGSVGLDANFALQQEISAASAFPTIATSSKSETIATQGIAFSGNNKIEPRCNILTSNVALQEFHLRQGESVLTSIESGGVSPVYTTGAIEIQIEFAKMAGQESDMRRTNVLSYMIEWLADSKESSLPIISSHVRVDAESIEDEIDLVPDDSGYFWLSARGHCVKICRVQS